MKKVVQLQDNFNLFNVYEIIVPEGKKRDKAKKKYLKKYQERNFLFDETYKPTDLRCSTKPKEKKHEENYHKALQKLLKTDDTDKS